MHYNLIKSYIINDTLVIDFDLHKTQIQILQTTNLNNGTCLNTIDLLQKQGTEHTCREQTLNTHRHPLLFPFNLDNNFHFFQLNIFIFLPSCFQIIVDSYISFLIFVPASHYLSTFYLGKCYFNPLPSSPNTHIHSFIPYPFNNIL